MVQNSEWRPSAAEVAEAEKMLRRPEASRFVTRLRVVEALKKLPKEKLRRIASEAFTRTSVVKRLLGRWQTWGRDSLLEYGRPKDLNPDQHETLKRMISSGSLGSLYDVKIFLRETCNLSFDLRSIRACCRRLGFILPVRARPPIRLHRSWNDVEIARLAGENAELKNRLTAVLRACIEPSISLRQACGKGSLVPEATLRADLKALKSKAKNTLDKFVQNRLRIRLLDRLHLRGAFEEWATKQFERKGKPPTAGDAVKFLKDDHDVKMEMKTAYHYLAQWKRKSNIGKRSYKRREKFMPSEGFAVRSIR